MTVQFFEIYIVAFGVALVLAFGNLEKYLFTNSVLGGKESDLLENAVWYGSVIVVVGCIVSLIIKESFWAALFTPILTILIFLAIIYGFSALLSGSRFYLLGKDYFRGGSWSNETYIRSYEGWICIISRMEWAVGKILGGIMLMLASVFIAILARGFRDFPAALRTGAQNQGILLTVNQYIFYISIGAMVLFFALLVAGSVFYYFKGAVLRRRYNKGRLN